MPAQILDGEKIAMIVRNKVAVTVRDLAIKDVVPGLAVVLVGEDAASETYVRNKEKACNETGINSFPYRLPGDTTETQLLDLIGQLNADPMVHGILVQLPLPRHIDAGAIFSAIDPAKDVDGFHPLNVGKLCAQENTFVPCTPQGIMYLLAAYNVSPAGKHAVIVGRSGIVGKPVAQLLLASDATVTICHSKTTALGEFTRQADVLVVAAGRPRLVTASMVKPGAVVVDVGINRLDGDLVGDVDFESVKDVASYLTPVPGGVGPLTIAMLLKNTVQAATIK